MFLILATYAIMLFDSAKNFRWPEFLVRGSILVVLVAYLFLLSSSAGVFLLGPFERIHKILDNLPEGIVIGTFLLLFHVCHKKLFLTSSISEISIIPEVRAFFAQKPRNEEEDGLKNSTTNQVQGQPTSEMLRTEGGEERPPPDENAIKARVASSVHNRKPPSGASKETRRPQINAQLRDVETQAAPSPPTGPRETTALPQGCCSCGCNFPDPPRCACNWKELPRALKLLSALPRPVAPRPLQLEARLSSRARGTSPAAPAPEPISDPSKATSHGQDGRRVLRGEHRARLPDRHWEDSFDALSCMGNLFDFATILGLLAVFTTSLLALVVHH